MYQRIVVGPTADASEPGFKHPKLGSPKLRSELIEEKDSKNLLFENMAAEELIGDFQQEIKSKLLSDFTP